MVIEVPLLLSWKVATVHIADDPYMFEENPTFTYIYIYIHVAYIYI